MINLEFKILNSIETKKLNPEILGERKWYNYFIRITELFWSRNNFDGYQIEVYSDNTKKEYLATITI